MSLLRKKCEYCREKIEKGEEVFRDVKTPGFVGTKRKAFMSQEHADCYEQEIENHSKKSKGGGGCC